MTRAPKSRKRSTTQSCFDGHVKAELRASGLLSGLAPDQGGFAKRENLPRPPSATKPIALEMWRSAVPLPGTLGEYHLAEHRGLHMRALGDMSHVLRWCGGDVNVILALMTEAITGEPCGVQRIYVSPHDGGNLKTADNKNLKKMLGNAGVIRITPDEDVTLGLGICEGIEDALTIMQGGWAPMWAASSAGAIAKFPVLSGIEALTIFRDEGAAGTKATNECATRWHSAGREVYLASLKDHLK